MDTKLILRIQLECGHDFLFNAVRTQPLQPWHLCSTCGMQIRIYAVECREWHARCRHCRYSRWTGQSGAECESAANRHALSKPGHNIDSRYKQHPDKFQYVRRELGVKVRVFIAEPPKLRVVVKHKPEEEECPF